MASRHVANVEKVERIVDIMEFGVVLTPALVMDGQVKSAGNVLSEADIRQSLAWIARQPVNG